MSPDGTVPRRTLGGRLEVSAVGYGAMVLTGLYGRTDEDSALRVVRHAVDAGVTLLDTADAGTPEELHREKAAHSRHHDDAA